MPQLIRYGVIGFFIFSAAWSMPGRDSKPRHGQGPALTLPLPAVSFNFATIPGPALAVEPRRDEAEKTLRRSARWFPCPCRYWRVGVIREKVSRSSDPIGLLSAAFRSCQSMSAMRLDLHADVESYGEGYFGNWTRAGRLVTGRVELTDEPKLRHAFRLLVESLGEADDPDEYWLGDVPPETTLNDYRRDTDFRPDMFVIFSGTDPLYVELSLSQMRMLVRAGDNWEAYGLDRWGVDALKDFLFSSEQPI